MTLDELKKSAKKTVDEHGQPAVLIPLSVWEKFMGEEIELELPQHERIKAVLQEIKENPDKMSEEWWDDFDTFLRENRVNFEERDLDWGDE
jgi:PHD/YefM family antitoxin component YafN of YafNO toxin-antitoxin module